MSRGLGKFKGFFPFIFLELVVLFIGIFRRGLHPCRVGWRLCRVVRPVGGAAPGGLWWLAGRGGLGAGGSGGRGHPSRGLCRDLRVLSLLGEFPTLPAPVGRPPCAPPPAWALGGLVGRFGWATCCSTCSPTTFLRTSSTCTCMRALADPADLRVRSQPVRMRDGANKSGSFSLGAPLPDPLGWSRERGWPSVVIPFFCWREDVELLG